MKVLFIVDSISVGGAGRVVSVVSEGFQKRGINTSVLLMAENEFTGKEYIDNQNVKKIFFLNKDKEVIRPINKIVRMRKIFREEMPDIVIAFINEYGEYAVIASRFLPIKVIISERIDPKIAPRNKVLRALRNPLYALANAIVFQTTKMKEYFPKIIQKKGVIILNPINRKLPVPFTGEREKKFVSVGRLSTQKNYYMAIDAFKIFSEVVPGFTYEIYGSGPLEKDIQSYIQNLGLDKCIYLKGQVSDVAEKINKSKAFIISSNYEGLSNAMIEAAAMGIPVISTDREIGDARMIVNEKKNGYLVPINDRNKLAKCMIELVESETIEEDSILEAKCLRKKLFPEMIVDQWLRLCNSILKK